jgi:hypothetical protein
MVQYSWAASRIKNGWFKEKFNRLSMRKSRKNHQRELLVRQTGL